MADLLASSPGSGRRDGIYPELMFRYQPQSDTFLCPDGQVMKPRRLHSVRLTWEYVTKQSIQDLLIATVQNLRKLIGAIQNAPESAWKPLIRTLSWLCVMLSAIFTPNPPGCLVFAPI